MWLEAHDFLLLHSSGSRGRAARTLALGFDRGAIGPHVSSKVVRLLRKVTVCQRLFPISLIWLQDLNLEGYTRVRTAQVNRVSIKGQENPWVHLFANSREDSTAEMSGRGCTGIPQLTFSVFGQMPIGGWVLTVSSGEVGEMGGILGDRLTTSCLGEAQPYG